MKTSKEPWQKKNLRAIAQQLLEMFEAGEAPAALARVLFRRKDPKIPSSKWSITNRLLIAGAGHIDARGFRQWQKVHRTVKKGERALRILAPITVRAKEARPEKGIKEGDRICVGFKTVPVFGYSQTKGEPIVEAPTDYIDRLPLIEVARSWGIAVDLAQNDHLNPSYGTYKASTGDAITLYADSVDTWCHELVHAAEDRLPDVELKPGQHVDQEIVAQLGATVLLEALGHSEQSDPGETWRYLKLVAPDDTLKVVSDLLDRTCRAVEFILQTTEALAPVPATTLPGEQLAMF